MRRIGIISLVCVLIAFALFSSVQSASAEEGSLNISWRQLDNFLRPGGQTTLFLTIENPTMSSIPDINLKFLAGPHLEVSMTDLSLSSIAARTMQSTSVGISAMENAPSTTSYIEINVTYYSGSKDEKKLTVRVPVIIRTIPLLQLESIEYDPNVIEPGSEVTLSFDIKNYGDGPARNVVISLDQTSGLFTTGLSERYVGEVPVNGSARVSFLLTVNQNLNPGTYSFPILLTYQDETRSEIFSSRKLAGLTVYGKFDFIVTIESQETLASGLRGNVEVKIANGGTLDAQFLQIKVLGSQVWAEISPSFIYVGRLRSDDYYTEKISLKVSENVPKGFYPLSFELIYQDPFGKKFSEVKTVEVEVLSQSELTAKFEYPIWGVGLAVFLVIFIVYLLNKRRK